MLCLLPATNILYAQTPSSLFDKNKMEYKGDKAAQAKLLLRKVSRWGKIIEREAKLDTAFLSLLTSDISFSKEKLKAYLRKNNIHRSEIGGSIDSNISFIFIKNYREKIYAKYFVIHDVSTPAYKDTFPKNINDDTWRKNNPETWKEKVTHIYLTRTGKTKTATNFSEGLTATKFEKEISGEISKGLFLHVEN